MPDTEKNVCCMVCDYKTGKVFNLKRHMVLKHDVSKDTIFVSKDTNLVSKDTNIVSKDTNIVSKDTNLICTHCDKKF